jgi:hypothetical protein
LSDGRWRHAGEWVHGATALDVVSAHARHRSQGASTFCKTSLMRTQCPLLPVDPAVLAGTPWSSSIPRHPRGVFKFRAGLAPSPSPRGAHYVPTSYSGNEFNLNILETGRFINLVLVFGFIIKVRSSETARYTLYIFSNSMSR